MLPTAIQASIHVVVRGLPMAEGAKFELQGYSLAVIGRASPKDWPDDELQPEDLVAVLWCDPREATSVVDNLWGSRNVIAVRREEGMLRT